MATDATGTPTPKGIPKYDVENDSPSGLGHNSAMDVIDSLLGYVKLRKNSGGSDFERGRLNLIEGAGVTITVSDDEANNEIDVTIAASATGPAYGTSLPASPNDGDEYILVDSTTSPTYALRFRYNAGSSSSYKWEYVGGTGITAEVAASETGSGGYGDLTTVGPDITIPRAGDWIIEQEFSAPTKTSDGSSMMSYAVGATAASHDWGAGGFAWNGSPLGAARSMRWTGLAASTLIRAKYYSQGTNTTFKNRVLRATPIRVS